MAKASRRAVRSISGNERMLSFEHLEARRVLAGDIQLLRDLNTNLSKDSSDPRQFTEVGSLAYFVAKTVAEGTELWRTDGTPAGTYLVKDINPGTGDAFHPLSTIGSGESSVHFLSNVNGNLYFRATDGVHGYQLWQSDGTAAGTTVVDEIKASAQFTITKFTNVNGSFYFSANDGSHGYELWKTDGTAAGISLVSDIQLGAVSSYPYGMVNCNGTLYFNARDESHGAELWKSDGTAAGTNLVQDFTPGLSGTNPWSLLNVQGTLYFVNLNGNRIARYNGNSIQYITNTSSGNIELQSVNDTLFFEDNAGWVGQWVVVTQNFDEPAVAWAARRSSNQSVAGLLLFAYAGES